MNADRRFERIACVVAPGAGEGAAVRRATALAGAGATIELISVALVADGARRIAQPEQIDDLAAAAVTAAVQGVRAQPHIAGGPTEADAILDGSSGCDLLVIAPGATANELVVRGDVPVLVAVYTGIDGRPDRLPASIAWRSRTPADWAGGSALRMELRLGKDTQ